MNSRLTENAEKRVRGLWPDAFMEENTSDKYRVRWLLWRSRIDKLMTEDLLGCGDTQSEAWQDAEARQFL